jgi:hypothetical protein
MSKRPNSLPRTPGSPGITPSEFPGPASYPPGISSPPLIWSLDDLARASTKPWLWQGYLAPGLLTLLTGRIGLGLTTLARRLLARMATGGPLAGLDVAPPAKPWSSPCIASNSARGAAGCRALTSAESATRYRFSACQCL